MVPESVRSASSNIGEVVQMKNKLAIAGLLAVAVLIAACSGNPQRPFTVSGQFIVADLEEVPPYLQEMVDSGRIEVEPPIDISAVTVSVVREVKNEEGEKSEEVLASGSFENGMIELEGMIAAPTEVSISIDVGSDEPMKLNAIVAPDQELGFKLVDQVTPASYDQLMLVGEYRIHEESEDKYVISGDLSDLEEDLAFAEVRIYGSKWDDEKQTTTRFMLGPVNPTDGKFMFEDTASDPMVVTAYVQGVLYKDVQLIAEAGVEVGVSMDRSTLVATAPEGSQHYAVVNSWAMDEEYLAKVSAYEAAFEAFQQEAEAKRAEAEAAQEEDAPTTEGDTTAMEDSEASTEADTIEDEEPKVASADLAPVAEGCEHIDTSGFEPLDLWSYEQTTDEDAPEHQKLQAEVSEYRTAALQRVAENLDDPLAALLAVEMRAYSSNEDQLAALDKLATSSLDPELVEKRVVPQRDSIFARMETETNDRSLVPGQVAPEFKLASLDGTEVSLYETIAENDHVLVDFWASWCGPCIASFPKLKKLHAAFNDDGFEIISISIDETFEEWEQKSTSLELPWIDVGEVDGKEFEGTTAVAYGVGWIPKGYLIDSKGCIIDKDMMGEKLQELLVAEHGDRPELHEEVEEEETEASDDSETGEV